MAFLDRISWLVILFACATIGLAPFTPEPHVLEKLRFLVSGQLTRPIDIFDFALHGIPWLVLALKAFRTLRKNQ
ncbi:MAG TPA: RND transporter [Rhodobacteraceae bacterium]|nr:RND transporter [Paracoccaceae bacterium]